MIQWEQPLTHVLALRLHTKHTHVNNKYHEPSSLLTSAATTTQISLASVLVVSRQKPVQAPLQALLLELPQYLATKIIVVFISVTNKGFVTSLAHHICMTLLDAYDLRDKVFFNGKNYRIWLGIGLGV